MANNKVKDPNVRPGRSEFSWGPGLEAPLRRGAVRTEFEQHRADFRTDSLDPASAPDYEALEDPGA